MVASHHAGHGERLAQTAQGASRILGQFGRPKGASVKHPDLYHELLGRYEPGVVLDYCMNTGVCGHVALELKHRFLGVELLPAIYSQALAGFEVPEPLGVPSSAPVLRPKRKAEALCTICTVNTADTRPSLGGGVRCYRCGMYWKKHDGKEEWHLGVKPRGRQGRPRHK